MNNQKLEDLICELKDRKKEHEDERWLYDTDQSFCLVQDGKISECSFFIEMLEKILNEEAVKDAQCSCIDYKAGIYNDNCPFHGQHSAHPQ